MSESSSDDGYCLRAPNDDKLDKGDVIGPALRRQTQYDIADATRDELNGAAKKTDIRQRQKDIILPITEHTVRSHVLRHSGASLAGLVRGHVMDQDAQVDLARMMDDICNR